MAHQIHTIAILDSETGGLIPTKNPMCSIGISSFSCLDGSDIGNYHSLIQPYANLVYEDKAMAYHGIKYGELLKGKSIKQVVADLCEEFIKANLQRGRTTKPILAGHNIGFDIGMLQYAFTHCKVDISKFLSCYTDGFGNQVPHSIDTRWLSTMKYGGDMSMDNYKLSYCCEKNGISLSDAHNAANDVASTKQMLILYMNQLRSNIAGEGIERKRIREHFKL